MVDGVYCVAPLGSRESAVGADNEAVETGALHRDDLVGVNLTGFHAGVVV